MIILNHFYDYMTVSVTNAVCRGYTQSIYFSVSIVKVVCSTPRYEVYNDISMINDVCFDTPLHI